MFTSRLGLAFFGAVGLYSVAFAGLFDLYCVPLYVISILSFLSAVGVFQMKRWGLWSAFASAPIIALVIGYPLLVSATASASSQSLQGITFRLSLVAILTIGALVILVLLGNRRDFK